MVQAARGEKERGERFTLFSDQRTEYRLERQKKERNTQHKEQIESKESDCRTQMHAGDFTGAFKIVGSECDCFAIGTTFSLLHT